jgi:signal transduction histidine kinase
VTALALMVAVAIAVAAVARAAVLHRRLLLVARADHELRAPLTTLLMALERGAPVGAELERLQLGLADLAAARSGRRAPARPERVAVGALARRAAAGRAVVDWSAGDVVVRADPRRLSQALGNLVANATQHGRGQVVVRGRRAGRRLTIEVADDGPGIRSRRRGGQGLAIAGAAVAEAEGLLRATSGHPVIELPVAEGDGQGLAP